MLQFLGKILGVEREDLGLLMHSFLLIFIAFASYALLKPIRDALGISSGSSELKWLFLATFIVSVIVVFCVGFLSGAIKLRYYLDYIYGFFALNLLIFFALFLYAQSPAGAAFKPILARVFYVWVSVFNMLLISSSWSLLVDIFKPMSAKNLFGIIISAASFGNMFGAFFVAVSAKYINISSFILISFFLLLLGIWLKNKIIIESKADFERVQEHLSKNPFDGILFICKSKNLAIFALFIFLSTGISTFLYIEQARIIEVIFPKDIESFERARIQAFATLDFIVQCASFFMQFFLTARLAKRFGIAFLLASTGILMGFGFLLLMVFPSFLMLAIVLCVRRIGEYALVRPAREMLFSQMNKEEKYKVKSFVDIVVYRGGDAIFAQFQGLLAKSGAALIVGAIIAVIWGISGIIAGKSLDKNK